ncbi:MAG: bifunctional UDP-N-acetylglucosamine diphosphorylase/glucosamine-1-phosphate N-acetyltransferase GlmU [Egibacteraceae bacterium]
MSVGAVVLAAGRGTRFRSGTAKVLHQVCGRSLSRWVLEALRPLGLDPVVVVVGYQADEVRAEAFAAGLPGLVCVTQAEQRGTGHALRQAFASGVLGGVESVLVVPGDTPMLTSEVVASLVGGHRGAVSVLTTVLEDPSGYGRIVRDASGEVVGIVEHRDASQSQLAICEVNTSMYVFDRALVEVELGRLGSGNDQGEEYLTDVVAPLARKGVTAAQAPAGIVAGVNDRVELSAAGALLRARLLDRLMRAGVTVVDPATTYVGADVRIGVDTVLLPGTHLEGATTIGSGAQVGPDTRLVDTTVGDGAILTYSVVIGSWVGQGVNVGPFASLRPGTRLEAMSKAGTFVEMKNSRVGEGSKVPHLSYIGDTTIGKGSNIGAATVTVNYDGFTKHRTVIGDGVKIGSDTMLVAPILIGDGAYTGAGSVITEDVPDGALAVERGEQRIVHGYADRKRAQATRAAEER